jgi:hypothetical protein
VGVGFAGSFEGASSTDPVSTIEGLVVLVPAPLLFSLNFALTMVGAFLHALSEKGPGEV